MPTIRQVAKLAGVSISTVSAVINRSAYVSPELTQRVQQAARELRYTANAVARGLQSRSTRLIGMLVPDIAEPVYSLMVQGVERSLRRAGYSLLLGSTHNRHEEQSRYLDMLRSKQVDGMLMLLGFGPEEDVAEAVETGRPIVFIARPPTTFSADVVVVDNVQGAARASPRWPPGHAASPSSSVRAIWRSAARASRAGGSGSLKPASPTTRRSSMRATTPAPRERPPWRPSWRFPTRPRRSSPPDS